MLLPSNTALAEAVSSVSRRMRPRLRVDWTGDGTFSHAYSDLSSAILDVSLDREARHNLPREVVVIEGHSSARVRVRLEGSVNGTPVARLFSTWRADSPLAGNDLVGARVEYDVVVSTRDEDVVVPRMRGVVRSVDVSSGSRRVEIDVLDLAFTLYSSVSATALATLWAYTVAYGYDPKPTAQWVVDHILRRNELYGSPPMAPGSTYAFTGHGSWNLEAGTTNSYVINTAPAGEFVESNWPPLLALDKSNTGFAGSGDTPLILDSNSRGFTIRFWVYAGDFATGDTTWRPIIYCWPYGLTEVWPRFLTWIRDDGWIATQINDKNGATPGSVQRQMTGAPSWRYVGIHYWRNASGLWEISIRSDGGTTAPAALTVDVSGMSARYRPVFDVYTPYNMSNLCVWQQDTATPVWEGEAAHVSQTSVAPSLNKMKMVPPLVDEKSLDVLDEVAAAEFARFGFDEEGVFRYTTADATERTSLDREVTAQESLVDLGSSRRLDSVRNEISLVVVERSFDTKSLAKDNVLIEAGHVQQFKSPPGTTIWPVSWDGNDVAAKYAVSVPYIDNAGWTDDVVNGFHVVRSDNVTIVPAGVTVFFWRTGVHAGEIHVLNNSGTTVQFQTDGADGQPALRVEGWPVRELGNFSATKSDAASIAKFGRRVLKEGENRWRSRTSAYNGVVDAILPQTKSPVTHLEDVEIVGDPRVQVGDLHRVLDPRGLGRVLGLVQGYRERWTQRGGLRTSLTYRVTPERFTLDDAEFGALDSNNTLA